MNALLPASREEQQHTPGTDAASSSVERSRRHVIWRAGNPSVSGGGAAHQAPATPPRTTDPPGETACTSRAAEDARQLSRHSFPATAFAPDCSSLQPGPLVLS